MGPTVVHGNAIVGGDGSGRSRQTTRGRCSGQFAGSGNNGSISTVKHTLTGGEFAEVLFVFGSEIGDKFGDGFVGSWVYTSQVAHQGEDPCWFKKEDGEIDESNISNGVAPNNGNALHLTEAFPK